MDYDTVIKEGASCGRRGLFCVEHIIFRSFIAALSALFNRQRELGIVRLAKAVRIFFMEESLPATIAGHREVIAMLNQPSASELKAQGGVADKYFSLYMAKSFDRKTRREILLHHYRYMADHVPADFHAKIFQRPLVLWQQDHENIPLQIALTPNPISRYEGELSLVFFADGISIFELSFVIVQGAVVGSASAEVLLVGRVQGGRRFDLIRIATKACEDISPKLLLMTAAQSVATVLGAHAIIGIGNDQQVGNPDCGDPFFLSDYDAFWESQLAVKTPLGFYELPLPLPQKPLSEVSATHRRRARRKRLYRNGVGLSLTEKTAAMFTP